ncbi:MAG: hypothetical protein SCM11_14825 [Bacillota bacterium]|nr:hypothetical protein [Bacillota bacterium]
MKKTSRPTIVILTLALALVLTALLGGCTQTETASTATSETTTATTKQDATSESTPEPTPQIWEEAEATLYYYKAGCSGPLTGWLDDFVVKHTGCHIEFVDLTAEVTQTLLAGGELPDLISFQTGDWENVDIAINGNMLVCLDEYQDALPDLMENVAVGLQFIRDMHSADTGKAYVAPDNVGDYYSTIVSHSKASPNDQYGANVRWDVYQAIGAPEVSTFDDFLTVLRQMQDYYPETEDGQKVYAFSLFPDWDAGSFWHATQIFTLEGKWNGLAKYFLEWDFKTNEVSELLAEDNSYLKALKFFYEANQLGLVDPDSLIQTYATASGKVNAGQALTAWVWNSGGGFNTKDNVNADPPVGFASIIFDEYAPGVGAEAMPIGSNHPMGIGAATEHLEECLRFLNFFYTYEANMTFFNGPQGDLWDINEDGNLYATNMFFDKFLKDNTIELTGGGALDNNKNIMGGSRAFMSTMTPLAYDVALGMNYWPDVLARAEISNLSEEWTKTYGYDSPMAYAVAEDCISYRPLAYYFLETTPDDISSLSAQIGDIVETFSWQMVLASDEDEFNTLYQEMLAQAEALGLDLVMEFGKTAHAAAIEKANNYE